jgi:plasmid stability protein
MKNITVTVDDETYRRARVRAAEQGTSVSRVVKEELVRYSAQPSPLEERRMELEKLFAKVDAEMRGKQVQSAEPGWRNRMYDERFDETKLGRRLNGEDD